MIANQPALTLFVSSAEESGERRRAVATNNMLLSSALANSTIEAAGRTRRELLLVDPIDGSDLLFELSSTISQDSRHGTGVVSILRNVTDLILHDRREALEKTRLYEQLKHASDELERKVQAATADIAEQNELLRRQAMEVEQASTLKSQFLANMSHEFRTPLNAILGYTSMLLQGVSGPVDDGVRRQLGRIESNGRHLLTIINEILDISRIEAGQMPLRITKFTVGELIAEVRAELEPIIHRTTIVVSTDVASDVRAITSDRQKVKQILLNLLGNALKFTHKGSITLSARRVASARMIAIAVADTGIGIAPANQETIFEDFRQLDNSPTRAYGGTGLGLSICRRLSQMLGGGISVRSQLNHGSTFTVMLPTRLRW
jgi:signal transduction histidine kinase